jgi:hypothetical protein
VAIRNFIYAALCFILALPVMDAGGQSVNHWETVVMSDDTWRYIVPSAEPSATWTDTGFNDSGWLSGPGGIGYGDGDDLTVIGPEISVFMRHSFNITDKSIISHALLHVDFDDAFVAYLNGHEIARINIGTAGIRPAFNQSSILNTYEAKMPSGGVPAAFLIPKDTISRYLLDGNNVLALQVHNASVTSSDLSSTTFLSVGITVAGLFYRPVPSWFTNPFTEVSYLPVVVISTGGRQIPDDPKIVADFKVIDNGPGQPNGWFDPGTDYDGKIGIEVRGQSSQMFPKKSYALELRSRTNSDTSASLLGMPAEEDWILHAHYSDKSMLRNAITFYLGGKLGTWQPRFRYCTVYLDGQYNGIYLLMENIKRGAGRVDISNLRRTELAGDDITGGYIVKVDKTWNLTNNEYFTSSPASYYPNSRAYNFSYVYPDADSIMPLQKEYIKAFIDDFESYLNSGVFTDPVKGYRKYIDPSSFVDFQVMQELSNNVDGYRYSTFFHKKKINDGGKLVAGPLWDFDLCYGNVNYSAYNLATSGWLYTHYGPNEGLPMHWWYRLMEDPSYVRQFITRWRELRRGTFRTDSVMHFIDSIVTYLGAEVNTNFQRWPILGTYVWPNYFVGNTYQEEIIYLKTWLTERLNWLDEATDINSEIFDEAYPGKLTIFPNPVRENLTVVFKLISSRDAEICLFDLSGRKVLSIEHSPQETGNQELILNMSNFNTGYYILTVIQDKLIIGRGRILKY